MNKIVFIIPGASESCRQKPYKQIADFFRNKGIKPIPVNISWKYKTISDYVDQFMNKYNKYKNKEIYIFGFSYGALIAFIVSTKIKPKMQILCSLTPCFKEDLPYLKNWWKKGMGKRRIQDLKKYSFNQLVKKIKCRTILVAGSKEIKQLLKRVRDTNKKLKNSKLVIIPKIKHPISQKEYVNTIKELISNI